MKQDFENNILYEDPQIIVCHKPAGIPVQSSRIGVPDMVSLLKNHLAASQRSSASSRNPAAGHSPAAGRSSSASRNPSSGAPYLGVIHRLDQPVEGLIVFAKTPAAAKELSKQLTSSGFGKHYRALVMGTPEPPEGTLEDYLVKDARTNTSRVCTKDTPGAKLARLHYHVKEICEDTQPVTSLVEIQLDTGRHHQIRVQMAHLGCPLVGDRKYGGTAAPSGQTDTAVRQLAAHTENTGELRLCAYCLEFRHPESGKKMIFSLD